MGVANKGSQNKHRQLERQTVGQTDNTTPTHAVPECGQCPPSLQVPATNVNQLRLETIINANCGFICTQTKDTHTCTLTHGHAHTHAEVTAHAEEASPKFSDPLNFDQSAMGL